MNTSSAKNSRAFTLVETLVAIAILMISISGPLAIANKALVASLYAKDQSTASFLAQEEMEIIKNVKDNGALSTGWLGQGLSSCVNPTKCDFVGSSFTSSSIPDTCSTSIGCPLYTDNIGYNHSLGGNKTIFSRYFNLTGSGNEYQATVVVSWNEGTVPNAVTMSSELLDVAP